MKIKIKRHEKLKKLQSASGHKFIFHKANCTCTICMEEILICTECNGSHSATFNSLTTKCCGEPIAPEDLDSINSGLLDFDDKGWYNALEKNEPSVLDVAIMPIGTIITSNQNVDFVVFAHYENVRGKRGIRLIETAEHMQANPEMRSYIFANTMAPWFPTFAEALNIYLGDSDPS